MTTILLSPSKTLTLQKPPASIARSAPHFAEQPQELVNATNNLGSELAKTLGVSEKIAELNRQRFIDWKQNPSEAQSYPAAWMYRGETFAGLAIETLDQTQLKRAQKQLYIVSGLYGLLKPQDAVMPYRLEMSTRLHTDKHTNLYTYWGSALAEHVLADAPSLIVNCASNEYSKAVLPHLPATIPVVTPRFLHEGKAKMVFAKFMRGTFARWTIEHQPATLADFQSFDYEDYTYDASASTLNQPVYDAPPNFTLKGRISRK